ncbi:MAG: helix-turn-helix domain-containing protein [Verrucomicrobiota bacterium]
MEEIEFNRLVESVKQAKAVMKGEMVPGRVRVLEGPNLAKSAREKLNMTQQQFADTLETSVSTVRSWEQGTRAPSPAAHLLLKVANKHPETVLECV